MLYLPLHVKKDAQKFAQNFDEACTICGELLTLTSENEKAYFDSLHGENFVFYDLILPERNIYYPANFVYGLYIQNKTSRSHYLEYMNKGALFGLLRTHNFVIRESCIRFYGAFAAVLAAKQ